MLLVPLLLNVIFISYVSCGFLAKDTVLKPIVASNISIIRSSFLPSNLTTLKEYHQDEITVLLQTHDLNPSTVFLACTSQPHILQLPQRHLEFSVYNSSHSSSRFNVSGIFLGYSYVYIQSFYLEEDVDGSNSNKNASCNDANVLAQSEANVWVAVSRTQRVIDHIFVASVAILVSLIYINFGCALNWDVLKQTFKRPVGPTIGFLSQFGFMPIMSFLLGRLLFPGNTAMQLGLFFTGCSPGGGASNIWTVVLGGNLDLSVTMTTISTFTSFAMVPLWVFTIGRVIFDEGNLIVPYSKMSMVAAGLIVPLLIGTFIQFYFPRAAKALVKIMKPFAVFLIIFIIIFGTLTNLYLFSLITWKLVLGGLCIPWLGYIFGGILSKILGQPTRDVIAIAIETGVQNTGISIYLLKFTLGQPEADLAQVCPVMVSLMTPIPLTLLALYIRFKNRHQNELLKKNPVMRLPSNDINSPVTEQAACLKPLLEE